MLLYCIMLMYIVTVYCYCIVYCVLCIVYCVLCIVYCILLLYNVNVLMCSMQQGYVIIVGGRSNTIVHNII